MKVHSFGDSWAYGAELKKGDRTFGQLIADRLKIKHLNHGMQGFSMGNVLLSVFDKSDTLAPNDLALVVLPPDIRWYSMDMEGNWQTYKRNSEGYEEYFLQKPIDWFIHHHNIFMYTMQSIFKDKRCKFLFMHNYGNLVIYNQYHRLIDRNNILSNKSLTELLHENSWDNYSQEKKSDGPRDDFFKGKYFEGNKDHPNQLGHMKIAELINNKMKLYEQGTL